MSHLLRPKTHEEVVFAAKRFDVALVPEGVVLGEANAVQPGALGVDDKIVRRQLAVVGERVGVGVKIDQHGKVVIHFLGQPVKVVILRGTKNLVDVEQV